jgi:hypothetical protein
MVGVTPEQTRDFYRAAANFHRQAPWKSVTPSETIKVDCEQLGCGPWYAVVLGKENPLRGLILFDDEESSILMEHADYATIADRLRNISVHFEDRNQVDPEELAAIQQHRFEVDGPGAYPQSFRMERSRQVRLPVAWELELLEACLWTIPDFLERAKDRAPDVLEYAFKGMIGRMTFDLSWVARKVEG